jgi:hypothetical protein
VLLANQPGGHHAACRQGDGSPEEGLRHEDPLGMVAQGTMTKVGSQLLGFI